MGLASRPPAQCGPVLSSQFLQKIPESYGIWLLVSSQGNIGQSFTRREPTACGLSLLGALEKMKKHSSKHSPVKSSTTAANLETRFNSGKDVLDYFDASRAMVTHGGARPGAGRKSAGKLRKTVKLSPEAIKRFQDYGRRKNIPDFSAVLEEASTYLA